MNCSTEPIVLSAVDAKFNPHLPMNDEAFSKKTKHILRASTARPSTVGYFNTENHQAMYETKFVVNNMPEIDNAMHDFRPRSVWTRRESPHTVEDCVSCCIGIIVFSPDPDFVNKTCKVDNILQRLLSQKLDINQHKHLYIPIHTLWTNACVHKVEHMSNIYIVMIAYGCLSDAFVKFHTKEIDARIRKNDFLETSAIILGFHVATSHIDTSSAVASCLDKLNNIAKCNLTWSGGGVLVNNPRKLKLIHGAKMQSDDFILRRVSTFDYENIINEIITRMVTVLFIGCFFVCDMPKLSGVLRHMITNPLQRNCKRGCVSLRHEQISIQHIAAILSSFDNDQSKSAPYDSDQSTKDMYNALSSHDCECVSFQETAQSIQNKTNNVYRVLWFMHRVEEEQSIKSFCNVIQEDIFHCILFVFDQYRRKILLNDIRTDDQNNTPHKSNTQQTSKYYSELFSKTMRNVCPIICKQTELSVCDLLSLRQTCKTTHGLISKYDFIEHNEVIFPRKTSKHPLPNNFLKELARIGVISIYISHWNVQQCNPDVLPDTAVLRTQQMQPFVSRAHLFSSLRSLRICNNIESYWISNLDLRHMSMLVKLDLDTNAKIEKLILPDSVVELKIRKLRLNEIEFDKSRDQCALRHCNVKESFSTDPVLRELSAGRCNLLSLVIESTNSRSQTQEENYAIHTKVLYLDGITMFPWETNTFLGVEHLQVCLAVNVFDVIRAVRFCPRIQAIRFIVYGDYFKYTMDNAFLHPVLKLDLPSLVGLSFRHIAVSTSIEDTERLFLTHVLHFFSGVWTRQRTESNDATRCFEREGSMPCDDATQRFLLFE